MCVKRTLQVMFKANGLTSLERLKCFVIHYAIIIHLNFDIGISRKRNFHPKPTKKSKIGKQCSGKYTECPWDQCNSSQCHKGCASRMCTKMFCNKDSTKKKNQLCLLKSSKCEKGFKCVKQDDGCNNDIGRCVKMKKMKLKNGKQCSGKRSECPWDNCNSTRCYKGCASRGCTKMFCNKDPRKKENQLCLLKSDNCEKGFKCLNQDDGCNNGVGRCVKIFQLR